VITLNRFHGSSYFQSAISRLQLAEYYLEAGNRRAVEQYLEEIMAYELLMEENSADSRDLSFVFGRASQLLRDYAAAVKYYEAVPKRDQFYDLSRQFLAEILGDD
jgi:tetratricopeptide (TPR) repeat protein